MSLFPSNRSFENFRILIEIDRQIEFDETSAFPKFQLRQLPLRGEESVDQEPSKPKVDIKSELRRRKPNTDSIDVSDVPLPEELESKEGNSKDSEEEGDPKIVKRDPREPLKWFGILVPQSLREAQTNFSRGIFQANLFPIIHAER